MNPWPVEAEIDRGAPAAPGPRRPRRHAEVRPERRARHPRARERARDRRARRRRRRREGVPAGVRRRGLLARDPDHLRQRAAPRRPDSGRLRSTSTSRRCAASTRTRARRWSRRSTDCARPTSRSAACSRCARSGSCPGSARTSRGRSGSTAGSAQAILSIQALKGVAIGDGFEIAGVPGSEAHDEIFWDREPRLLPRDEPRRRGRGRDDDRRAARRPRLDEAAADAHQAAALGRHLDPRAGRGAARANRLVQRCPRPAWSGRRWSRSCSPTPTGGSSAGDHIDDVRGALARIPGADRMAAELSAENGESARGPPRDRLHRLHGRGQDDGRAQRGRRARDRGGRRRRGDRAADRQADRRGSSTRTGRRRSGRSRSR